MKEGSSHLHDDGEKEELWGRRKSLANAAGNMTHTKGKR